MNASQAVAFDTARTIRSQIADAVPGAMGLGELADQSDLKFDDVVAAARSLMGAMYAVAEVQACRKCGCWEMEACEGGCWWVEEDLCSACAPKPRPRRKRAR